MLKKTLATGLAIVGIILIVLSIFPILVYEWQSSIRYPTLISPVSSEDTDLFKFVKKDYTKAENWFAKKDVSFASSDGVSYYSISIPKLKIDNAIVRTDSDDLSQNLVQFPGSSLPGKRGNTVIFGHSILPIFFNPKKYISIFSTLYKLDTGDEVFINYNDATYRYLVTEMFEVKPSDIQVLEQNTDTSYISLITCAPPGDPRKPRRLVVRAKITPV